MAKGVFYIYRFFEGEVTIYVGKGKGRRFKAQQSRFRCSGEILEYCVDEMTAYERERHWIAELKPTENKNAGGAGGVTSAIYQVPKSVRGIFTLSAWKRHVAETNADFDAIERIGSRKYCAQFLLRKLNEANCEQWGLSKVDIFRLREVAHG